MKTLLKEKLKISPASLCHSHAWLAPPSLLTLSGDGRDPLPILNIMQTRAEAELLSLSGLMLFSLHLLRIKVEEVIRHVGLKDLLFNILQMLEARNHKSK